MTSVSAKEMNIVHRFEGQQTKTKMTNVSVRYLLTAQPTHKFRAESIFASYYAGIGVIDRGVNWAQADTTGLGLLLLNMYLILSPALTHQLNMVFDNSEIEVPSKVMRMISGLYPLRRGLESYSFDSELKTMDDVRHYLLKTVEELEVCKSEAGVNTYGYMLSQFSDKGVYDKVVDRAIYTLRCYLKCDTAAHLVGEIAVSLAMLRSVPGFPGPYMGISRVADFSTARSDHVPYGPRKYIPIKDGIVSFVGEPSDSALILSRMFINSVKCVFDNGFTVAITSPIIGSNIIFVEEKKMGDWLLTYLQLKDKVDILSSSKAVSENTTVEPSDYTTPSLPSGAKPKIQKQRNVNSLGSRQFGTNTTKSVKWDETKLYRYKDGNFFVVGSIE